MAKTLHVLPTLLLLCCAVAPARAQDAAGGFRTEFLDQFDASAGKLVALAEAMPAESYAWRPMEGVASVAEAYLHIARYNYYYPDVALGVPAPAGVDVDGDDLDSIGRKPEVVDRLRRSLEHVRQTVERMSDAELEEPTRLYGRDVTKRAVLLQLITHMNEHLGQSIAYARSNRVAPPWSR